MDFTVEEEAFPPPGRSNFLLDKYSLPMWNHFAHIVPIGETRAVICGHPQHAIDLIRADYKEQNDWRFQNDPTLFDTVITYLIISVREIILYRTNGKLATFTKPQRFFNGFRAPSSAALDLLLESTYTTSPCTLIHRLPAEIQDMILEATSHGPIEPARIGCILNIGSAFKWKWRSRYLKKEERRRDRDKASTIESGVYLDEHFSGVVYA